ncbi:MAG: type II secretion system protein [Elusimicrobia bacterium]|nr:type II secretion system protein [Elusimicrobiota bacterium]
MKRLWPGKKLNKKAGFTLLEICLGILILGYAMIILARLFGSVTMSAKASEFETLASNFARAKMEDLKNRDYDSLPDGPWTPDVWAVDVSQALSQKGILMFTRQVKISYMKNVGGILTISATDEGLKKTEVKVSWNERGKVREVDYTSLVARGV